MKYIIYIGIIIYYYYIFNIQYFEDNKQNVVTINIKNDKYFCVGLTKTLNDNDNINIKFYNKNIIKMLYEINYKTKLYFGFIILNNIKKKAIISEKQVYIFNNIYGLEKVFEKYVINIELYKKYRIY